MLRKFVAAIILVPLAIVIIAFAVANRQAVTVSLDPFSASAPAAVLSLPLFALINVTLIVGVINGGVAAWLGQGKWRRAMRRFERDVREMRARLGAYESDAGAPGIVPREQPAPPRLKLKPPAR